MKTRLRDLGITPGKLPAGPENCITDVGGILVGHSTVIQDSPRIARTGVTAVIPCEGRILKEQLFAGFHSYNGCGEMTGTHWIAESGMLTTPILITNTGQVGTAHEALGAYYFEKNMVEDFELPVIAETWDGWLSDMAGLHLQPEHVFAALDSAAGGPVVEGNVGGGTGMICHEFKGGIGSASRRVRIADHDYTVGVLVQANYGVRRDLRLDGVPVGLEIGFDRVPSAWDEKPGEGSIIILVATDAPLLPHQCRRLAQRGATGLARTGGFGHNGSGDIFLAFSTANAVGPTGPGLHEVQMLRNEAMNPLFNATAEAVEESIWNALVTAETMTGFKGRTAHAIPHDLLVETWRKYRPTA